MLRVGYDAQAFLSPNGGTGKGAQLRTLIGPFIDRFVGFASTDPNPTGMPLVQEGRPGHTLWQEFSLPGSLRRHEIDVFLAPYNVASFYLPRRVELILVLHDMILLKKFAKPDLRGRLLGIYRRWQIPASIRRASIVLTVSEHARSEILAAFPRAKVRVISCTVSQAWFDPRPLDRRVGYLLMVTSSAPHKNAAGALEAYAKYAKQTGSSARPLKVVGLSQQAGTYHERLQQLGVAPLITFMPYLSERELISLYQDAAALVFPSFAEGFGIPMLEAMATGTPVIASRATSLPEVGGDAAYYFDPNNVNDMAAALETVLTDDGLRERMAAKGLDRAEFYRPEVIGRQVMEFWEEVAGITVRSTMSTPPYHEAPASTPFGAAARFSHSVIPESHRVP